MSDNKITPEQRELHDECHKAYSELLYLEKKFLLLQKEMDSTIEKRNRTLNPDKYAIVNAKYLELQKNIEELTEKTNKKHAEYSQLLFHVQQQNLS